MQTQATVERFWSKVDHRGPDECWPWQGWRKDGYGGLWDGTRNVPAHRFSYELLIGPIPERLQIDHLCRVRHCVNPRHLEPVTPYENWRRGQSPSVLNAAKTHCPQGHPYSGDNLFTVAYNGARRCRICKAASERKARGATLPPPSERTHCPHGHPYAGENLYIAPSNGARRCRICMKAERRAYYYAHK